MVAGVKTKKWELTGVSAHLRERVRQAAAAASMTQTAWIQQALESVLTPPVRPHRTDIEFEVDRLKARLNELETTFAARVRAALVRYKN